MFEMYFKAMCEERGLGFWKCAEYDNMSLYIIDDVTTWELWEKYDAICAGLVDSSERYPAWTCFDYLGEELMFALERSDLYEYNSSEVRSMFVDDFYDMICLECVFGVNKWSLRKQTIFVVGEKDCDKFMKHLNKLKDAMVKEMAEME